MKNFTEVGLHFFPHLPNRRMGVLKKVIPPRKILNTCTLIFRFGIVVLMTLGLILIALVGLFAVLAHRRSRFEHRIFKHVPINEWLTILIFPLFMFVGWAMVMKSIIYRPNINIIPIDDFDFIILMVLFLLYVFVGDGLHFTSKIIWRYLPHTDRHKLVYKVNEMFHNKLSHYLVYVNITLIIFVGAIMELNHPIITEPSRFTVLFISFGAIIFGFSAAKSVYYTNQWFGGYNRPLSSLCFILLVVLLAIYRSLKISLSFYPFSLFVMMTYFSFLMSFLLRQIMIFTRLNNRHKLRFLNKILSA